MTSAGLSNLNGMNSAASGVLDQRLSLDVQGVDALRRTVRASPQEGMKQASKQFEVMFMQMMLKSMREATPSDGMFSSSQEKTYTAMLDQQLSQNLSGRGLGLAEAMLKQLSRAMGGEAAALAPGPALRGGMPPSWQPGALAPKTAPVSQATPDLSFYEAATAQATLSRSVLPQAHVEQFVTRMLPAAQRASQASGVPAQLIMAQAALESGWGRREIRSEDGSPSYNIFGIKADKSWKGPVAETTTTEYVNGVAQKSRATFRAYGSYDEAFTDYARFLVANPRYTNVLATQDPATAAHGLQRAGYATDPEYGGKLVRIMKQMS
ncbi:MAG: flagellar rod assembly protein/muramidase FlgJ [Polaromonas sp. 39-63-203]|jgi:flagellar protein FlgJ|uniref:flagellar assembly peptidoglycan hydrolase FlgJ n=1 Tax=Polaromonas sp. TaxID=1869339 RepID=UPI000BC5CFC4|nr:flagellar assembly peptidoglycan hydrolase FlgJ [Polaromonas sp.]OYY53573.1 MAG: flagellar rod assembly protein/muramidase FlgJ [Polaromonas sp. 35-63-240]OYZ85003.1 MAG: flagellar rod assembly protein/muramidase FlgJ [Polaromonas sp. 24-62-144]OZB02349.1 MAG: flagellar rod assembly protein/muramidase FlgJ [Polaromonas sp. 39-63-203]HQS32627.1 flagellar assembly peptidoglycan hydrolase FlgJ [Polaromonas sp.]HQS90099.1 flagellar assembly peptidoglycan hydrolase FlgJ [Polaromonas sp.]